MKKERIVRITIAIIIVVGLIFIYRQYKADPLVTAQSLADSISSQLVSRISNASQSNLNNFKLASILVVWSDTGKVCTDIQELIPSSYWPKTTNDINNGYLVSIAKTTGESARYGTSFNYVTGYQVVYAVSIIFNGQNIKRNSFAGAGLPMSIRVDSSNKSSWYGAPPSNSVIADWIKNTLCTQPR
ncbi:MAG: hypothetical protein PHU23_01740 [Dehalococcoidales bacterium]|nr:hypothetical protein [Dehalococcoidales bacterium]